MWYGRLIVNSHCHAIIIKAFEVNSSALSILMDFTWWSGKIFLILIIYEISFTKAWFLVDNKHTCDHSEEASMSTIKYINDPYRGCIGPQKSPWIRSRNAGTSSFAFRAKGLVINFPVAHAGHTKSSWFGKFFTLTLCPCELLIIFLIILRPRRHNLSCQR